MRGSAGLDLDLDLEPRSGYRLSGSVRWAWQHSIPGTRSLRHSLTFRTLKTSALRDLS